MSDESNVLSIPLAGGGTLKVNRDNKAELARAIRMFKPEDVRRIMAALAQDNKVQEMENEIEDEKTASERDRRTRESRSKRVLSLRLGYVKIKKVIRYICIKALIDDCKIKRGRHMKDTARTVLTEAGINVDTALKRFWTMKKCILNF